MNVFIISHQNTILIVYAIFSVKFRRTRKSSRGNKNAKNSPGKDDDEDGEVKKDKKLVFLSKSVLQKVRERPMVTGTQIANEILEMYKTFCDVSDCCTFIILILTNFLLEEFAGGPKS